MKRVDSRRETRAYRARKVKSQKVRPDQALAPERQVVPDRPAAPLREGAMGLGIGGGQFAWTYDAKIGFSDHQDSPPTSHKICVRESKPWVANFCANPWREGTTFALLTWKVASL